MSNSDFPNCPPDRFPPDAHSALTTPDSTQASAACRAKEGYEQAAATDQATPSLSPPAEDQFEPSKKIAGATVEVVRRDFALAQAAVYRVSSMLLARGTPIWMPSSDFGSDCMTGDGIRIQVKAARLYQQNPRRSYYWFALDKGRHRKWKDLSAYHVFWGSDEDRYWIIPSDCLADKKSLAVPSVRDNLLQSKYAKWEDNWAPLIAQKGKICNIFDGPAGVHRVASELLFRGVNVFFPAADVGVDIGAANDERVQVKAARLGFHDGERPVYGFNLNTHLGRPDGSLHRNIEYSKQVDWFILWGIDECRFWIVPARGLNGRDRLKLGPKACWIDPEPVTSLRDAGKSYQEISRELGISIGTAWRKICVVESGKFKDTARIRQYEGRWDLIVNGN